MNRERRKRIEAVMAKIDEAKAEIECLRDEEQEAFDNMPESVQSGERGDKVQAAIEALEEVVTNIEDAVSNLETAAE